MTAILALVAIVSGFTLLTWLCYVAGWLFWSWLLMLAMGNWGPYTWSYAYVLTHWGLLCPFVLG